MKIGEIVFYGEAFPSSVPFDVDKAIEKWKEAKTSGFPHPNGGIAKFVDPGSGKKMQLHYLTGPKAGQVFEASSQGVFLRSPDEPVDRKPKQPNS